MSLETCSFLWMCVQGPVLATGKAPTLRIKENYVQIQATGKETELQKIAFNSLFFAMELVSDFFCFFFVCFFWLFLIFFQSGKQNWNTPRGDQKSNSNLCFSPILFLGVFVFVVFSLSIFPLQKKKPTLKPWHFTDLKARYITASRLLAGCHKDIWCKWKEHCFWIASALLNITSVPDPRKVIYILSR